MPNPFINCENELWWFLHGGIWIILAMFVVGVPIFVLGLIKVEKAKPGWKFSLWARKVSL